MGAELIEKLPGLAEMLVWAKQVDQDEVIVQLALDDSEAEAYDRLKREGKPGVPVLVATRADVLRAAGSSILFFSYTIPGEEDPDEIGDAIFEFLSESGFLVTYTGDPNVKIGIAVDRFKFIKDVAFAALGVNMNDESDEHGDDPCPECAGQEEERRKDPLPDDAVKLNFSTARYEAHLWFNGTQWVYNIRDTEADNISLERGRSTMKSEVIEAAKKCVTFLETEFN